jgi:hypothetical protein
MVLQVSSDDQKREQGSENNPNVNAHRSRLAAARHPDNRPAALNRQLLLRLPISCRVRKERRYRESINLAVRIEFTPQQHDSVVYLSDGNHQQCYHAGDHPRFGE